MGRSIMWFRRDLRIRDNPALTEACWNGDVMPVVIIDPAFDHTNGPRGRFFLDAVAGLANEIRAMGGELIVRAGDPIIEIGSMAAEHSIDAVMATRDFSPYGVRRDAAVAEALARFECRFVPVSTPYAVPPGSIRKQTRSSQQVGEPYSVFTPFLKRWRERLDPEPTPIPEHAAWIAAESDPLVGRTAHSTGSELDSLWGRIDGDIGAAADARWRTFSVGGQLADYATGRNFPARDGTSRMSPFIKLGVVHPRELLSELDPDLVDHQAFEAELAWRDFYADVLFHHPEAVSRHLDPRFDTMRYDTGRTAVAKFDLWCRGQTGFPIVDAGMRQLGQTGWMHNRVRMITASFLVKDLHLPWTWGARFFMRHLIDGDIASNSLGWQWAAGSGTDAAPYFRVFNPTTQQQRWDPDGEYVARWVPELGTSRYPAPMLDHGAERAEALARFKEL